MCVFLFYSIYSVYPPIASFTSSPSKHMLCYLQTNVPNVLDTLTKTTSDVLKKHMNERCSVLHYPLL